MLIFVCVSRKMLFPCCIGRCYDQCMPDDWWLMFLPVVCIFGDSSFGADVIACHEYHAWYCLCAVWCVFLPESKYIACCLKYEICLCEVDVIAPDWCGWCHCLCSLCPMLLPCSRCYAIRLTLLQLQFRNVIQNQSHMWSTWYFPIFLLRDGLFTLM